MRESHPEHLLHFTFGEHGKRGGLKRDSGCRHHLNFSGQTAYTYERMELTILLVADLPETVNKRVGKVIPDANRLLNGEVESR